MNGCEAYNHELDAYLDGELDPRTSEVLQAHLPGCGACSAALGRRECLEHGLRSLPPVEPSPQFEARFWARLARAEERPSWRERWFRVPRLAWVAGGAALVLGLALLVSLRDPALSAQDWAIVADAEGFDLVLEADPELLAALDVLEAWRGSEEI
jgi:anti-sigma factor RsiW